MLQPAAQWAGTVSWFVGLQAAVYSGKAEQEGAPLVMMQTLQDAKDAANKGARVCDS